MEMKQEKVISSAEKIKCIEGSYIKIFVLLDSMGGMIIDYEKESQSKERYRYKDP